MTMKFMDHLWTIHDDDDDDDDESQLCFFLGGPAASSFIGVLDIFGFEHFKVSPGGSPLGLERHPYHLVMTHSSPWYRWPIYIQLYSYCIYYIPII